MAPAFGLRTGSSKRGHATDQALALMLCAECGVEHGKIDAKETLSVRDSAYGSSRTWKPGTVKWKRGAVALIGSWPISDRRVPQ